MATAAPIRRQHRRWARERARVPSLVVVDDSEELSELCSATPCNRARLTGGKVALTLSSSTWILAKDFQHWQFVGNLMEEEAHGGSGANALKPPRGPRSAKDSGSSTPDAVRPQRQDPFEDELFALVAEHPEHLHFTPRLCTGREAWARWWRQLQANTPAKPAFR